jgi:hypothetical protein
MVAIALGGCVSVRGVSTRGQPRELHRFAFYPTDDPDYVAMARSPVGQAMRREVEQSLTRRGLTMSDDSPDFWVACYFLVEEKETAPFASPLGPLYLSAPSTNQYLRSTVVVDFLDPGTRNVFWRGTARAIVGHPENPDPRRVAVIVDKLMHKRSPVREEHKPSATASAQARRQ